MDSQEDIDNKLALLSTYRRTLTHLLQQAAQFGGETFAPPQTVNGIDEAREHIQYLKTTLRSFGVAVSDEAGEEVRPRTLHGRVTPIALSPQEQRYRDRTLTYVREVWIKGVLENSLHGVALIALGLETRPEAVAYPWQMVVERPGQAARVLAQGTRMDAVFDELDGELLILGAPGAGKTTMLLDLARTLINRCEGDMAQPIPAVFTLSLWAERHQSLDEWLVDELSNRYGVPTKVGRAWIENGRLLPLLDGLDEIRIDYRGACVQAINTCWKEYGLKLVVCSRLADYESLVERLQLRGAVLIQPLTPAQIETYLDYVGEQLAALRADLQTDSALRELAETPLMLSIMTLAYQGRALHLSGSPSSLEMRREQLFAAYVDRMLARRRIDLGPAPRQTILWLAWLARGMTELNLSIFYLEDLQPSWLTTRRQRIWYTLSVGSCILLLSVLAGMLSATFPGLLVDRVIIGPASTITNESSFALFGGLVGAVIGGVIAACFVRPIGDHQGSAERVITVQHLHWSWEDARQAIKPSSDMGRGLMLGLGVGLVIGLAVSSWGRSVMLFSTRLLDVIINSAVRNPGGVLLNIIVVSIAVGLCIGLAIWLLNVFASIIYARCSARIASGRSTFWRSIRTRFTGFWNSRLKIGLGFGAAIGFSSELGVSLSNRLGVGLTSGLGTGLVGGLIVWVAGVLFMGISYEHTASPGRVNQSIRDSAHLAVIGGVGSGLIGSILGGLGGAVLGGLTTSLSGKIFGGIDGPTFDLLLLALGGGLRGGIVGGSLIGAIGGIVIGLVFGFLRLGGKAYFQHSVLRLLIWQSGGTPLRYARFLNDAAKRVLLRKVGSGYIFIHRLIQEYFAALDTLQPGAMLAAYAWATADRGIMYREVRRYEESLADLSRAIELAPQGAWTIAQRGITYMEMQRYEEALSDFNRAIELNPKYAWAIGHRGVIYMEMQRYEEALSDFSRAIELNPKYAWAIAHRGMTYRLMERYEQALADFSRAIELNPKYAWAIARRGQTYWLVKRYEEALADLTYAIELIPDDALTIAGRGLTYQQLKRYEEALADLTHAIELNPTLTWAIVERGQTYRLMERYEEALTDFSRAIDLNPKYTWAIAYRGQTYLLMEHYEEALTNFTCAIELNPALSWAIGKRGLAYGQIGRYEEALTDFSRVIELEPNNTWAIADRGHTYRLMERYEEALTDFSRAIELDPNNAGAIAGRGQTYQRLERFEEALADFVHATDIDAENGWFRYLYVITSQILGQDTNTQANIAIAIRKAKQDYERYPSRRSIIFNLALYHLANNDSEIALSLYKRALRENIYVNNVRSALENIDEFLHFFSENKIAHTVRDLLLNYLRSSDAHMTDVMPEDP